MKFVVPPKQPVLRGDDGYRSFTIRVPKELEEILSKIAYQTYRSRNDVVTILLQEAVKDVVLPER